MKKILFIICILFAINANADQLSYLLKERAEKAVRFLIKNNIKEIISWCGCCSKEPKVKVTISKVYYRYTGYENFYQVIIEGTQSNGEVFNEGIDLAYVYIQSGKLAKCLGKALKFKCDPCSLPFSWAISKKTT